MDTEIITLTTGIRRGVFDITAEAAHFVDGKGDGLLSAYLPHATAGLALMETGAGSEDDLLERIDEVLPRDERWRHRHGSPGHGADHVLPALVAPSVTIPVVGGRLALGTWQSLVVVDPNADNPDRKVRLSFIPA